MNEESTLELREATDNFMHAYNKLAAIIHHDNVAKGFWPEGGRHWHYGGGERVAHNDFENPGHRNVGEALMLIVSEIAEGMEGHRKDLRDEHLPEFKSLTVELADAVIRIMDLGHGLMLDVPLAVGKKLIYNRERPHMHGKKF